MGTRALQLDILLSGLRDPDDGTPLAGGVVYFYAAGTTTAKNVWSEKAKTNAYTFLTLDANGSVANPYYGDGWYKIIVKDSAGATEYTWDQIYLQSNSFSVAQKTEAYSATADDDVVLCDGTFTVSLAAVATFEHPLIIKNIGTGTITIDPSGSETIDGSATIALSSANDVVTLYPDTASNVWRKSSFATDLNGVELILDADGDTSITADTDDVVDFKINGTDTFQMVATGFKTDHILEKASGHGVVVDGVLIKDDTIKPTGTFLGVDIGGNTQVSFKDGLIEPTTDNDIDLGGALQQFKHLYLESGITINAVAQGKDVTAAIHRKIIEIGDWNMDATASVDVAHGLNVVKIRSISALIRYDGGGATVYMLNGYEGAPGYIGSTDATNVTLVRTGSGAFDSTAFDETSYNRGWIIIDYVD